MFLILKIIAIGAYITFISSVEIINSFDNSKAETIRSESFRSELNNFREETYVSHQIGKSHRFYYTLGERLEGKWIINFNKIPT